MDKKGKRARESEADEKSDENRAQGESNVSNPAAKRQKEEFKAKVSGEKSRRPRQLHKDGSKVTAADTAE